MQGGMQANGQRKEEIASGDSRADEAHVSLCNYMKTRLLVKEWNVGYPFGGTLTKFSEQGRHGRTSPFGTEPTRGCSKTGAMLWSGLCCFAVILYLTYRLNKLP